MFVVADVQMLAVCGDEVDRDEVVDTEAIGARVPAESSTEGQSRYACPADHAKRDNQAVLARGLVNLSQGGPRLDRHKPSLGIDVDVVQLAKIKDNAVSHCSVSCHVVAPAAHCKRQPGLLGDAKYSGYVGK